MITRIRIDGEAHSAEHLQAEFSKLCDHVAGIFRENGGSLVQDHVLLECITGENWSGRTTLHPDTQLGDKQLGIGMEQRLG